MSTDATANLVLLQGVTAAGSAVVEAEAQRAQTEALQRDLENQERSAERRARDAKKRGESAESQQRQQVRKLIGAQRAEFAAQGIDIQSGSAFEIQSETDQFGAFDAATIRINAGAEVLGIQLGIEELAFRREIAGIVGRATRRSTLLTGGLQLVQAGTIALSGLFKEKPGKDKKRPFVPESAPEELERFRAGTEDPRAILRRRRIRTPVPVPVRRPGRTTSVPQ